MKPKTRLLIRLSFADGSMKRWGYDYPYFDNLTTLKMSIERDFEEMPDNTGIHLFYHTHDSEVTAKDSIELAEKAANWLVETKDYNGN